MAINRIQSKKFTFINIYIYTCKFTLYKYLCIYILIFYIMYKYI